MSGGEQPEGIPAGFRRPFTPSASRLAGSLSLALALLSGSFTDWFAAIVVALVGLEAWIVLWRTRWSAPPGDADLVAARRRCRWYSYGCIAWTVASLALLSFELWGNGVPGPLPIRWARVGIAGITIWRLLTWRGRRSVEKRLGARLLFFDTGFVRYVARSIDGMFDRPVGSHVIGEPGQTRVLPPIVLVGICVMLGWAVSAGILGTEPSRIRHQITERIRPGDTPDRPSESAIVGAGQPTAAASARTDMATGWIHPSPAPSCASDEAFLAAVGHTPVGRQLLSAWRKVGAVEIGCPAGPPEPWTYLEVVQLFGGVSDPSLVVANLDGSTAVVFDDLVAEVRRRADVLTIVEPRTETGRGHYTVLVQEDGSCLVAMRLKSNFPQLVLPEAASSAVFHIAGIVGGVPLSFQRTTSASGVRFDVRFVRTNPDEIGSLLSTYVSVLVSDDGSTATWKGRQFSRECPDPSMRSALAWEATQVREIVENRAQEVKE